MFWSLDWNQSRQLANGGQGDKEREREGLLQWGAAAASPRAWREGRPLGTAPGVRRPPSRPLPSFLPASEESQACVMASPLQKPLSSSNQMLLNLQPGDSSSAVPQPAPPPGPQPPARRLSPPQQRRRRRQPPPRHIPTPHPNFGERGKREREESQIPEEEGGANPHGFAIGRGTGRQRRGKEAGDRERKRSTRSGRGRSLRALPPLTPRSLPLARAQVSPGLQPSAPLLCPYSCPHTRSIRPKPPGLSTHTHLIFFFPLSLSSLHRTTRN